MFQLVDFEEYTGIPSAAKRCLANLCNPALTDDLVILTVLDTDQDDKLLDPGFRMQALNWALHQFGTTRVPLWTQSSGKVGTFYLVTEDAFEKLASQFDRGVDAEKFAAYIGLLFSDVTDAPTVTVPCTWSDALHGEDGNGVIARELWGRRACQFRCITLDSEGWPLLLGKGILTPVKGYAGGKGAGLNDTQIKWHVPGLDAGEEIIIAKTETNDKPIKIPGTFELIQLLKDIPAVREVLKQRTKQATRELLVTVSEGNELALLDRLGQLKLDGADLVPANRNVLSALRANFPWCRELEERLGRVFVSELVDRIAPSAGLYGWGYLAIQHDELGLKPCSWERAKGFAFRLPLTSDANLIPFERNPKGKVHPDAMLSMEGDSDGDRIVWVDDPEIVDLVRRYRVGFVVDHKPEKKRAQSPLTADRLIDLALQAMDDAPLMGVLTLRQHALLTRGEMEEAAFAGWLAQMSPMLIKWDITVDGQPARDVMRTEVSRWFEDVRNGMVIQWREKRQETREFMSPRELYHSGIRKPENLLDRTWNWMVQEVREWAKTNVLKPLSLPSVARAAWHVRKDLVIGGHALRWRRQVVTHWGKYWAENYGKDISHRPIYQWAEEMGESATVQQLVALLLWRPASGRSGFSLKWHVLGRRWEEVLGYRPEVAAYIMNRLNDSPFDQLRVAQLVEMVLQTEPLEE